MQGNNLVRRAASKASNARSRATLGGDDQVIDVTVSVNLAHVEIGEVSRIALALSGVRESSVRGQLRWSLAGRLVARQINETSIVIRTGFAEREQLLAAHPTTFFVPPRFDAHMMVVAGLAHADSTAVAAAIRAAWDLQTSAV